LFKTSSIEFLPQSLFLFFRALFILGVCCFTVYFIFVPTVWSLATPIYASPTWSCLYFSYSVYLVSFFTSLLYLLPNMTTYTRSANFANLSNFESIDGTIIFKFLTTPVLLLLLVHFSWSGPTIIAWFGHVTFSSLQLKLTPLLFMFFSSYLLTLANNVHFSSNQPYDFTATLFSFFLWLWLLLFSNNLFTFIFFLELLSALVMLTLTTSTFSSMHIYNNLNYSNSSYFQVSTPTTFLQTLLMFFWTTLVASLLLFVFLTMFYLQFLTFDWSITSTVFSFLIATTSLKSTFVLSFSWLLVVLCVFLKCGIVPFYLWKPAFFKGMTLLSLFFYIYIYYFTVFFYFTYVLFYYFNELFSFNIFIIITLLLLGTLVLTPTLFESFYLKVFLALSSILNSLLLFYALCSLHATDLLFVI